MVDKICFDKVFSLKEKKVIVTGGAGSIGKTIANYMAAAGADIAIFDLTKESSQQVADEIASLYGNVTCGIACNVTDPDDIERALSESEAVIGTANILVNNAGVGLHKAAIEYSKEDWIRVNDVNYNGMFYMAVAFARHLIHDGGSGSIINTCSMSSLIVNWPQKQVSYNSSKAGVLHMTKSLAVEFVEHNIRVNSVSPGYIYTDLTKKRPQELRNEWAQKTPQGRLGTPEDLAAAYIYLASDFAAYTTGSNIVIDGGYTIV